MKIDKALPVVLEQGRKGIYFMGTDAKFLREQGNTDNIGDQGTIFLILGNRETGQFIPGEQGNRYSPCEGLIVSRTAL